MPRAAKKNPADSTGRNVRASHKRDDEILERVRQLESTVAGILHTVRKTKKTVKRLKKGKR